MAGANFKLNNPVDPQGRQKFIIEASKAEEQLWTSLPTKGPLDKNVQELYFKARSGYVNAIFENSESPENYDSNLWWLHYGLIEELRSKIKVCCENTDGSGLANPQSPRILKETCVGILNGFQNFLAQSTEFYKEMIQKLEESYGISKECSIGSAVIHCGLEPKAKDIRKFLLLYHRFLISLGDLERYKELYSSLVILNFNLSIATHYYIKASSLYPASGNPHNQLAVSAMMMGDELLALYHFIRSLAIDEPFVKAWDNLLLFFKNMLNKFSDLHNASNELVLEKRAKQSGVDCSENMTCKTSAIGVSEEVNFMLNFAYPFIRLISIFCTHTRLDELPYVYEATLTGLEKVLSLNDVTLDATLQSCLPTRIERVETSAFRIIQIVSILIFAILCQTQEFHFFKEEHERQQDFIHLAWTAAFEVMGCIVRRCIKYAAFSDNPLLPGLLVFVEWCAVREDLARTMDEADENCSSAAGLFFSDFIDFLSEVPFKDNGVKDPASVHKIHGDILWEDNELRAFSPLSKIHGSAFAPNSISRKNLQHQTEHHQIRRERMVASTAKLVRMLSTSSQKWIDYQKIAKKFYAFEVGKFNNKTETGYPFPESEDSVTSAVKEQEELTSDAHVVAEGSIPTCYPCMGEEDEVIVFKPTLRNKRNCDSYQKSSDICGLYSEASNTSVCNTSRDHPSASHAVPSSLNHIEYLRNDVANNPASSLVVNSVLRSVSDLNISPTSAEQKDDQKGYSFFHQRNYLHEVAGFPSRVRSPSLCGWMVGRDKNLAFTEGSPSSTSRYAPTKGTPHSASVGNQTSTASSTEFSMPIPLSRFEGQLAFDNYSTYPEYCSSSSFVPSIPSAPISTEVMMNSSGPDTHPRLWSDSAALSNPLHFPSSSTTQDFLEKNGTTGLSGSSTMNDKFHRNWFVVQGLPGIASGYGGYMCSALSDPMRYFHHYRDLVGTRNTEDIFWPDRYNLYSDGTSKEPDVSKMSPFEKWMSPSGPMFTNFYDNSYRDPGVLFGHGSMNQTGKEAFFYDHQSAAPVLYGGFGMDQRTDQLMHFPNVNEQGWFRHQQRVIFND